MEDDDRSEWERFALFLKKRVRHGIVFGLKFENGRPDLNEKIRYEESRLFGSKDIVQQPKDGDGLSKARFANFVEMCQRRGTFEIKRLFVQDGLPHRWEVEGIDEVP